MCPLTFVSECPLVLLASRDNVSQGALHITNQIVSTNVIYMLLVVNIQYNKLESLNLFKTIFKQKGFGELQGAKKI